MALPLADLETWLIANDVANVCIDWLPDEPDAVVVIEASGGATPGYDGSFEPVYVTIRARATTDAAAEAQALVVHQLITGLHGSLTMGSTYVLSAMPVTPPRFMGKDVDSRTQYAAVYKFTTPTA